jgi:hypothetical protein
MKTLGELNEQLSRMRRETADYMPDYDGMQVLTMRKDCAALRGAIECLKRGETPVLAS